MANRLIVSLVCLSFLWPVFSVTRLLLSIHHTVVVSYKFNQVSETEDMRDSSYLNFTILRLVPGVAYLFDYGYRADSSHLIV